MRHLLSFLLLAISITLFMPTANLRADDVSGGDVRFDANDDSHDAAALKKLQDMGIVGKKVDDASVSASAKSSPVAQGTDWAVDLSKGPLPSANVGAGLPPLQDHATPGEYEWESGKLWRQFKDGKITRDEYIQAHKRLRERLDNPPRLTPPVDTRQIGIDSGQIDPAEPEKTHHN